MIRIKLKIQCMNNSTDTLIRDYKAKSTINTVKGREKLRLKGFNCHIYNNKVEMNDDECLTDGMVLEVIYTPRINKKDAKKEPLKSPINDTHINEESPTSIIYEQVTSDIKDISESLSPSPIHMVSINLSDDSKKRKRDNSTPSSEMEIERTLTYMEDESKKRKREDEDMDTERLKRSKSKSDSLLSEIQKRLEEEALCSLSELECEIIEIKKKLLKLSLRGDEQITEKQKELAQSLSRLEQIKSMYNEAEVTCHDVPVLEDIVTNNVPQKHAILTPRSLIVGDEMNLPSVLRTQVTLLQKDFDLFNNRHIPEYMCRRLLMLLHNYFKVEELRVGCHQDSSGIHALFQEEEVELLLTSIKESAATEQILDEMLNNYLDQVESYVRKRGSVPLTEVVEVTSLMVKYVSPLDLDLLVQLINENQSTGEKLKDKDVIILLGGSGAGKSTTINFLAGSEMKREKFQGFKIFQLYQNSLS